MERKPLNIYTTINYNLYNIVTNFYTVEKLSYANFHSRSQIQFLFLRSPAIIIIKKTAGVPSKVTLDSLDIMTVKLNDTEVLFYI